MIELKNITKKYNDKVVFKDFDIKFKENYINIITGPSGCGKTTLFNIISGADKNYDGTISKMPENVAYLFQEDRLLPYYNVLDNVTFILPETLANEEKETIAVRNLEFMELSKELKTYPHQLSGGMSRRVAIARALSYPCDLLLLDEPFNGLNLELKHVVMGAIIDDMSKTNKTVIIITHDTFIYDYNDKINLIDISKPIA